MKKILVVASMLMLATPALADEGNFWTKMFNIQPAQHEVLKVASGHRRHSIDVSENHHDMVTQVAVSHGVSPAVVHAIVMIESGGRCGADNGIAHGIMQVQTPTARSVGVHGNLHDCRTGLEAGVRYLRKAIAMHGNTCAAYSSYNTGIYTRGRCTSYGRKVMMLTRM